MLTGAPQTCSRQFFALPSVAALDPGTIGPKATTIQPRRQDISTIEAVDLPFVPTMPLYTELASILTEWMTLG
jgi:hypothetical protein